MRRMITTALFFALAAGPPLSGQYADPPARTDDNLIVGFYNIQFLGQYTHDYDRLAQVIQHFDVCGIMEVKRETAVADLVGRIEALTGHDWGYAYGVRTHRPSGLYHEAYAVAWRKDRVELGDGLVGGVWDRAEAFRNDPFVASFKRRNFDFSMILVHTRWSSDAEGTRAGEVAELAEQVSWLRGFLPERDIVVAGDFNYSGGSEVMESFAEEAGMVQVDPNLNTTYRRDYSDYANSYDHIYVPEYDTFGIEFENGNAGVIDATTLVYGDRTVDNMRASKRELSDHLPVWVVFRVDLDDDDGSG